MFKVAYAETSIDQKLNHARNCSITKVTYRVSIFQLKARVDTQNGETKVICKLKKNKNGQCRTCTTRKTKLQKYEIYLYLDWHGNAKINGWNCTSSGGRKGGHSHLLMLLQLSTQNEIKFQTLIATKNFKQKKV